ncbi:RHOMBOID-like protein 8 isoform X2 [Nymphaea colorata]|uniref:RHOMBOID-like protein 8 isoform X2 n=1 Tax=Nymphaea colorata TaxID=210225 RepID=UPI00214DF8AD|nr:RHOMBOID-like protein 8 isoform X2 [Nymphaea colorata]
MPSARPSNPRSTLGHSDAVPRKLAVGESGGHLGIEIRGASLDGEKTPTKVAAEDAEEKVPFFGSRYDRKEKAWVVSLAVALKLVVFVVAMFVNDCPRKSHGDCLFRSLRRFSFQPLRENPMLGPSASTLDALGALRRTRIIAEKQKWRLMTFTWLHGGAFHLVINISSMLFIGIRLAQDCGPWRTVIIYLLSAFSGSLLSALFVQNSPVVGASSPLFGLLGTMISGLIKNWSRYDDKLAALVTMSSIAMISFILGMLPYTDNFANVGSLISGVLLGAMSTYDPKNRGVNMKKESHSYGPKVFPVSLTKFDRPLTRVIAMILFIPFLL